MGGQHGSWWGEGAWDKVSRQGAVAPGSEGPGSISVLLQEMFECSTVAQWFCYQEWKNGCLQKKCYFQHYINEV